MRYGTALRGEITRGGVTPLIGIYDMYSASIADDHINGTLTNGMYH